MSQLFEINFFCIFISVNGPYIMSNNETYTIIKLKDDGLVKNRVIYHQDSEYFNLSFLQARD